jgi:hypothetical protein
MVLVRGECHGGGGRGEATEPFVIGITHGTGACTCRNPLLTTTTKEQECKEATNDDDDHSDNGTNGTP